MSTIVKRRKPRQRIQEGALSAEKTPATPPAPTSLVPFEVSGLLGRAADLIDPPPNPWLNDPVGFIHERLGEETWSKQDDILNSIRDHRKTAVRSAHSTGKSHIASRAVAWWLSAHDLDDVFIVTTAPTATQVKAILWRYIKSAHRKGKLPGFITEGEVPEWKIDGRLVAYGRKPQDLSNQEVAATAFQGIHARYVLVILDEAGGVPEWLWTAVDTLVTSPGNRVLAIGNPDDPTSHFERINRSGSGWNVIKIAATDTPNFTNEPVSDALSEVLVSREWVTDFVNTYGIDNPLVTSKVFAEFAEVTDNSLITPAMIRRAIEVELPGIQQGRYAADIARMGRDKTVVYRNRGGVIEEIQSWNRQTTDVTTDKLARIMEPHQNGVPMVIDIGGGLGAGPFDSLRLRGYPVHAFDGSTKPIVEQRQDGLRFKNRRAEQYWGLREEFERNAISLDPFNLEAQAQLVGIRWWIDATGRLNIEGKDDIKKRLGKSPDHADTIMMSTMPTDEWELVAQDRAVNPQPEIPDELSTADLLERIF